MRVSHETIHQSLYARTRGALKKELKAYVRTWHARLTLPNRSASAIVPNRYSVKPVPPWVTVLLLWF